MSDTPYRTEVIRHAALAKRHGRLEAPDATVTLDNPMCGDRVTFDVVVVDGRIKDLAHDVRACVLCQASASIVSDRALGLTAGELADAEEETARFLKESGTPPGAPFAEIVVFESVRPLKSRHTCVLLPFEALGRAVREAAGEES